ncbi:GntR family transcriptional regulator [Kutzneria buriramensis]|uniref:GntR family transcriptional regulator n=1 Tax=Kutzneria buriramensis TaxID=1045776 RepID=A0A3E0HHT0_9PSEU|nr:GntR family transcriptional regulator [Kutzneria buriramensis]REH44916.1 GntR family transcriptional regulator [Kutzneria buriramensis]
MLRLKYEQIADQLAKDIRRGRLPRGARLPGEHVLANRFAVSRNTIRQALAELGSRGLIATHSGKGSFVTFDGRPLDDRIGWTRALAEQGVHTAVEVIRLELVGDPDLAERCGVESDEFVAVDRVRSIVGGPAISFECTRVAARGRLRDLPGSGLDGSLYDVLRAEGLLPEQGEEWVELGQITEVEAAVLSRAPGERFLRARRLCRDRNGIFVEHTESLLDPDRFRLHLRFGGAE